MKSTRGIIMRIERILSVLILVISIGLLETTVAYSRTWYIKPDQTGDAPNIRSAVIGATAGDTILVAPGLYLELPIPFNKAIHLISESGPELTIIQLFRVSVDDVIVIGVCDVYDDCSIIGFTITGGDGGFLSAGGGIQCIRSKALIKDNIITGNWCSTGGGMYCSGYPSAVIEGNLFHNNAAWVAGAIDIFDSSPIIRNNTIVYNYATDGTSAVRVTGSSSYPVITNNIIANNLSYWSGGAAVASGTPEDQIAFECNDLWNNPPANYGGTMSDQTGINGNISLDPHFCGISGSNNYYLQSGSPCAEANVPAFCSGIRMGKYEVDCSVGVQEETWGSIKALFSGEGEQ
jgi:hypothetical protein